MPALLWFLGIAATAGVSYIASDVVDLVEQRNEIEIQENIAIKAERYKDPSIWIKIGVATVALAAVAYFKMTKIQRKKIMK